MASRASSPARVPSYSDFRTRRVEFAAVTLKVFPRDNQASRADLRSAYPVGGTTNVWLRFRTTANDGWWGWYSLAPGNHDLSAWMHNLYEVQVRSASGVVGPVTIVDFDILD